ncbi:MAG: hypothetical protein QM785_12350 [Pyrinomonadaceae bacterium]
MKLLTVKIDDNLHSALFAAARANDTSASKFTRDAVRDLIKKVGKQGRSILPVSATSQQNTKENK